MGGNLNFYRGEYSEMIDYLDNLSTTMTKETDLGHNYTPDVDHDQFLDLEDIGVLCVVIAKKDDEIVGFVISSIQNDIFFKEIKIAIGLFYYLDKDCRGNGNGFNLLKFNDDEFRRGGAKRAIMSRKIHIPNEKAFEKLGYTKIETNHEKYYD